VVSLIVGADGIPRDVKLVKSIGKTLDEKAIAAVTTWKFEPATKDGIPVATQINVEVMFRLK
jgi:protein TonB